MFRVAFVLGGRRQKVCVRVCVYGRGSDDALLTGGGGAAQTPEAEAEAEAEAADAEVVAHVLRLRSLLWEEECATWLDVTKHDLHHVRLAPQPARRNGGAAPPPPAPGASGPPALGQVHRAFLRAAGVTEAGTNRPAVQVGWSWCFPTPAQQVAPCSQWAVGVKLCDAAVQLGDLVRLRPTREWWAAECAAFVPPHALAPPEMVAVVLEVVHDQLTLEVRSHHSSPLLSRSEPRCLLSRSEPILARSDPRVRGVSRSDPRVRGVASSGAVHRGTTPRLESRVKGRQTSVIEQRRVRNRSS